MIGVKATRSELATESGSGTEWRDRCIWDIGVMIDAAVGVASFAVVPVARLTMLGVRIVAE